jgi:two-component system, NarL family, response regulator DesR
MKVSATIRILLADDHYLVRESIQALLDSQHDMQVVGSIDNGHDVEKMVQKIKPDIVVLDVFMPGMNGIHAAEVLQKLDLPCQVVILSMYINATLIQQALRRGAMAYVAKQRAMEELPIAIRSVLAGQQYFSSTSSPDSSTI